MIGSCANLFTTTVLILLTCFSLVTGQGTLEPYRDVHVLRIRLPVGTFHANGLIVLHDDPETDDRIEDTVLPHEYGHYLQQKEYGNAYYVLVAIPSMISGCCGIEIHHRMRWEIQATEIGR